MLKMFFRQIGIFCSRTLSGHREKLALHHIISVVSRSYNGQWSILGQCQFVELKPYVSTCRLADVAVSKTEKQFSFRFVVLLNLIPKAVGGILSLNERPQWFRGYGNVMRWSRPPVPHAVARDNVVSTAKTGWRAECFQELQASNLFLFLIFFFPLLQTEGNKLSFSKGHTLLLKLPAGRTCTFCSVRLRMKEGSQTSSIPSNNRVAHQPPPLLPLIFINFDESIKRIQDPK